jgi:lipopolysaccharide export LptBFGC system permease protein LptF
MKHAPTRSAIFTTERKLVQARRDTVESFRRFRSALHSRLARPSSLALAVGLAALIGLWLMRRKPRTARAGKGTSPSMAGLAVALLIRFGWQRLAGFLRDASASRHAAAGVPLPEQPKGMAEQR